MDNPKTEFRQEAIDWLNSKDRSIEKGLAILKKAGYKPTAVENFEKNKNRQNIPKKLRSEMDLYIRYCTKPDVNNALHEDELPFINPEEKFSDIEQLLQKEYPASVKKLLTEFRDLYTERSKQHNALKAVGEANDEKSMDERKRIGIIMDAASRRMDTLWKTFEEYSESGTEPDKSLFEEPFNPETIVKEKTDQPKVKALVLPDSIDELKKMSENWRTKIVKAENKLNYQSETKGAKLNPMPAGPKRITQEKRIAKLKEEKTAIDTKLAELK